MPVKQLFCNHIFQRSFCVKYLYSKVIVLLPHFMIPAVPVEVNELFILQTVFHSCFIFHIIALLPELVCHQSGIAQALMLAVMLARQAWTGQIHIKWEHEL